MRGKEIHAGCPFANRTHFAGKDANPSFSVNLEKGVFNCFTCGARGVVEELIGSILGITYIESMNYLENAGFSRLDMAVQELDREQYLPSGERNYFIPEAIVEPFEVVDKDSGVYRGEIDGHDCTIYVVRNYLGAIVGAVARATEERWHKVLWDMEKSKYLYGEDFIVEQMVHSGAEIEVVIVEGVGDALAVRKAVNLDNYGVVALMGAYASDVQVNKLLRFGDNFIVWLDNDPAGHKGTARLFKEIENRAYVVKYVSPYDMPKDCKDPRDVLEKHGKEKVVEIVSNAKTHLELQEE